MIRRLVQVLRWFAYPLAGVAVIAVTWYFGSADLRNLVLLLLGPFVAVLGVAVLAILLVVGPPAPPVRPRPVVRRVLPALRAHAEVAGRPMPLEAGDRRG